jgi:hypothetical protein
MMVMAVMEVRKRLASEESRLAIRRMQDKSNEQAQSDKKAILEQV